MLVVRSGIPQTVRGLALAAPATTLAATWLDHTPTTWIRIRNKGPNVIRVYFAEADFTADANFVEVSAMGDPGDLFEGPYELHQALGLYMRAVGGDSAFEMVYAQRI